MSEFGAIENDEDEISLAKSLMNSIDNGTQNKLPELFKIAHLNPKVFVHCEKYFKMGIDLGIDKYECMNDYGLIQMLKGNDPSEYFKKSYEEGQLENSLFNYAVFTKREDLLKESADKYENPMAMLLYYQLTKDINYLQKSAITHKNPFALTLLGLYRLENKLNSELAERNAENSNKNAEQINNSDKNKEINENNNAQNKEENANENNNDDANLEEEEEDNTNEDIDYNDGQRLLTQAAILTKPGDKYNLLPFPSALFYNKEFVNECRNNIKRAADANNPHSAFLYAYMCNDLHEKAKYYKLAGDQGLSDGYFQYCKLVRKNSSLFSPSEFDSIPEDFTSKPQKEAETSKNSQSTENNMHSKSSIDDTTTISNSNSSNSGSSEKVESTNNTNSISSNDSNPSPAKPSNSPNKSNFDINRLAGEMDNFIDFQRNIFDITSTSVPTVSQSLASAIVDLKSVYKLVHNIMLAVDFRPFEANLNALANLATSVHFLIFDESLQNLFRDLLIQEACANTSRNRSRFFFIELCIDNFMFSMEYFCRAVSYIKQFKQGDNYNRYVELWFPEVRKFIIQKERENQNESSEDEENETNKDENKTEKLNNNENSNETNNDENKEEVNDENKTEKSNNNENSNDADNEENKNEANEENKTEKLNNNENSNDANNEENKTGKSNNNGNSNDANKESKNESSKSEKDDSFDFEKIDLDYFFDTSERIKNKSARSRRQSFRFLPFRDTSLTSSSFIVTNRRRGNPDPLSVAIRHDDVNTFKRLLVQSKKMNVNTRIEPSFFELSSMLDKRPSLLCYCAFFNATRCFSFLVENEADTLVFDEECRTVSAYAAAAGATRILARLEAVGELEHQEAAEFAARFHRGRIMKRLMEGRTMSGAVMEEEKENAKAINDEIAERQKRQMMQELQIRKILLQQQRFIQQQEMINQRDMKMQQNEQKLRLERFLIQQQHKIRAQQQNEASQEAQKTSQEAQKTSQEAKAANKETQPNEAASENKKQSPNQPQSSSATAGQVSSSQNSEASSNLPQSSSNVATDSASLDASSPNQPPSNAASSSSNAATDSASPDQPPSNEASSSSQPPSSKVTDSASSSVAVTNDGGSAAQKPAKRSSFFGKYADLQKQVLLEQRKQQLLKQQQQEQQRSQGQPRGIRALTQELSLPPALSKLVASQEAAQKHHQQQDEPLLHRRQNPYRQEPIEEPEKKVIVRDGQCKVEEKTKVIINGLLSDFVESLSFFSGSEQDSTKEKGKKKEKEDDDEEEEEESNDDESDDDNDDNYDFVEADDGLLPLFTEDVDGADSASSIFYKICELGNSGVVHFFTRELWRRMLVETVHGDGRETVMTRIAALGNYDMLSELLKIADIQKMVNITNVKGNTPLDVAIENKNQNVVDILEAFLNE